MIIAGLTGSIGHGKTTFANLLAEQCKSSRHFETWELVAEVATALKEDQLHHPAPNDLTAINGWLHSLPFIVDFHMHAKVSFDDLKLTDERLKANPEHFEKLFEYLASVQANPKLAHTPITDESKDIFRPLLQWLGGYLVAVVGSGVWYDELIRRIAQLRSIGYELVTVGGVRYPADAERMRNAGAIIIEIKRSQLPSQDVNDLTERERSLIESDCLVLNDGSLKQLAVCAHTVYTDLRLRQLHAEYAAKRVAATTR